MLDRIARRINEVFTRRDLQKPKTVPEDQKYRFLIFEISFSHAVKRRFDALARFSNDPVWKQLSIRNIRLPEEQYELTLLYNKIFLASPDPTRPISVEEAATFPADRTFVAELWGTLCGFIYLSVDRHPLKQELKTGIVSGIGVLPRFRGKRIGVALLCKAVEFFEKFEPDTIIAEIYEKNFASQQLFSSFGFRQVGESYF